MSLQYFYQLPYLFESLNCTDAKTNCFNNFHHCYRKNMRNFVRTWHVANSEFYLSYSLISDVLNEHHDFF